MFFVLQVFVLFRVAQEEIVDRAALQLDRRQCVHDFAEGRRADIIMTDKRLGDKLKYAAKVADFAVVIGEEEVKSGKFMLKNLATGEVTEL